MGPPSPVRSPSPSRRKGGGRTYRSLTPTPGLSPGGRLTPLLGSPSRPHSERSPKSSSPAQFSAGDNPYATFTAAALQRHRDVLDAEVTAHPTHCARAHSRCRDATGVPATKRAEQQHAAPRPTAPPFPAPRRAASGAPTLGSLTLESPLVHSVMYRARQSSGGQQTSLRQRRCGVYSWMTM